ncbi:ImmA/IrrE family metallo-endopeptidase [Bradyrhizobium sp. 61]|uniref:XRE family transcriptional regulator n=1 Tax=Bradyrhizobium sp. 61 TaxID=2782679 RepID=UPI001FF8D2AA|nr:XRE family transcriptional regulator [Bradyrhizobium sp. 61]MCK1282243.1 ImmA/IrrE family metallo-endopeptidase [Bradyrhizobium sp. 61]
MATNKIVQFPSAAARATQAGRLLIPSKLRDARKVARLSQGDLGDLIGVSRQAISAYERGDKSPEPSTFQKISEVLDQPVNFFTNPDRVRFGAAGARFYRKFGPETLRRNEAAAVLGDWFVQTAKYFDEFVNYPMPALPECAPRGDGARYEIDEIDEIALNLRKQWGLGPGPISNVLALLEAKGIVVCRYEMQGENVEAFSFWNGARPFVFMASEKEAGVRLRYDLAHELGHLVLHRWVEQTDLEDKATLRAIESEADKFAGAFLLPSNSFPNEVYTPRLDAFVPLKARWKVSIQAMVYRCRDLDLIDADQALNLYKQISFRRWRKKEPLDDPTKIPIEQPRLLRRAVELLIDSGKKHPEDILNELGLSAAWIEKFCALKPGTLKNGDFPAFEPTLK